MLNEPTIEKLNELKLGAMAIAWIAQQKDTKASSLSFDERLGLLVDAEWMARDNRRLARLLKDAGLRISTAGQLAKRPLIPVNDPYFKDMLLHGNQGGH